MADTLIYVTHIDDSIQCLQGPCLYFWGRTRNNNLYLLMEQFLEKIKSFLESCQPPSINVLAGSGVCCVLIGHQWYRAIVPSLKLDHSGKLKVLCIDNGKTHSVPLSSVRTLDTAIPGSPAENIRKWRPLSTKFILADVSAPIVPGCSNRQWSAAALTFLKKHVKNQTWKAALLGAHGEHQGVRLFDSNNQLLAKYLVDRNLGVAAQTYKDAINMCDKMRESAAYSRLPKIYLTKVAVPPVSSSPTPKVSLESSSKPHRSYLTNKLSEEGRHDVVVSNMANGPFKFVIRLTREAESERNLRCALDSVAPHPFPGCPKVGAPCIAVCPADKCFYRCLITAVDDSAHQPLHTVYLVDTGFEYQLSLAFICDIPNELLALPPLAYQVSLAGVEEVAELSGLNEIFSSLVKSAGFLSAQIAGQSSINLYDHTGRSFLDVLSSIKSNLLATILGVTTNSPNVVSSPTRLAEQVSKKKKILAVDESLRAISPVHDVLPMETTDELGVFKEYPDPVALEKSFTLKNPKLDEILLMDLNFAPGQLMSFAAVASHVKSNEEVWIQLSLTAVKLLTEEIANTDVLQLTPLEPEVGVHCLCFSREDGSWYRGVVNSIQEARVSVTLIDYGVSTFVDGADLRELPPSLAKQPGLALKCALDGSEMRYETSPTDEQCRSVIADAELLTVVFVRQSTSHLFVRLFDASGTDLNEKMGLPERNLLDFSDLSDTETSTASRAIPLNSTTDPIEIDLLDRILSYVSISPNAV